MTTTSPLDVPDRPRYFPGQVLTAGDLTAAQEADSTLRRLHHTMLHGWGIAAGLARAGYTPFVTTYGVFASRRAFDQVAMAIALGRTGDLTDTDAVLWKLNRGTPYVASPLLYDGLLYFFQHKTPILTCLDAATGKPHFTQSRLDGLSDVYASPIGVQDRIYVPDLEGTTLVLAKSSELKILATSKLDDRFAASPVVVGNELFLRGHKNLYCIAR